MNCIIALLFFVALVVNIVHATSFAYVIPSVALGFGFGWFAVRAVLGEP